MSLGRTCYLEEDADPPSGATDLTCTLVADSTTTAQSGVALSVNLLRWGYAPFDDVTFKMPMNGLNGENLDGNPAGHTTGIWIDDDGEIGEALTGPEI